MLTDRGHFRFEVVLLKRVPLLVLASASMVVVFMALKLGPRTLFRGR